MEKNGDGLQGVFSKTAMNIIDLAHPDQDLVIIRVAYRYLDLIVILGNFVRDVWSLVEVVVGP
jgi:hypothetical protein